MKKALYFAFMIVMFAACSNQRHVYTKTGKATENSTVVANAPQRIIGGKPLDVNPNATAFRMSGDYSDNVAVTLDANGELVYFPAPTDITAYSKPISLGNGWWLNCQGLGPNSVFTKYTFAEYSSLPEVPSPQQLKMDILPGARVTEFIELPMKLNDAVNNINEAKSYLKNK